MGKTVEETVNEAAVETPNDAGVPEGYSAKEWADLSDEEREGILDQGDENDLDPDALLKIADEGEKEGAEEGKAAEEPKPDEPEADTGDVPQDGEVAEGEPDVKEATTDNRIPDEELMGYRVEAGKLELPNEVPDELQTKMDALEDKFEAGELSAREYGKERDSINREITNAQLALAEDRRGAQVWEKEQNVFLDARPEYLEKSVRGRMLYGALDATVRELAAKPENQRLTGLQILVKADQTVREALGIMVGKHQPDKQAAKADAKKATTKPAPKTPDIKTLGDVPVAARNDTGNDPFSAIDKLEGLAYEEAIERMSEAQRKAYMAR